MHRNALGHARKEIVKQVIEGEKSVKDYASYVPIGNAVKKLQVWKKQGAEILYLSSHENADDVEKDKIVLRKHGFPEGNVLFRQKREKYKDIVERIMPDVLIEDDCESIGGEKEMAYPHIKRELKTKITSIVTKEFSGIDNLPEKISELRRTSPQG